MRRARSGPISWGSRTVRPPPGITPTRAWVSAKRARSEAMRKSQFSAISNPPVTAAPFTARDDRRLVGRDHADVLGRVRQALLLLGAILA